MRSVCPEYNFMTPTCLGQFQSIKEAEAPPPAGITVQRLRLYCFATQDFGYVQISLGNTAIAVGACKQQTPRVEGAL